MNENLIAGLHRAARLFGEQLAVVDGDLRMTYGELEQRVAGVDAGLAKLGVERGDAVAVLALNSHRHFECWFAVPRGGAVLADLNTRLSPAELAFILDDCEAQVLVVDDAHLETARGLRERCPALRQLVYAGDGACPEDCVPYEMLAAAARRDPARVDAATLAGIFYTGGTTGSPKGVMLTHGNLVANAKHILIAWGYTGRDRYLHAGPMFHLADGAATYALTWVGGVHVIIPAFEPGLVIRTIEAEAVTTTTIVPTMISLIVHHPALEDHDLSSLRRIHYGAAPIPMELLRRAMDALPCEWQQAYGMTEAAPLASLCDAETHRRAVTGEEPYATRLGSAGVPVVGVEVEVHRADGSRADVGEAGEIWVRGPNVMAGYWRREQETAAVLDADGWYHSGDAAYVDADGYIYVVDRVKDMIISGGENVYSVEVERALYAHPDVLEAAVFGVPSEQWGEAVHAAVVLREGAQTGVEELIAHCREHIAGYKVPRGIDLRDEPLPKSGAGKIVKRDLRAPYWEGQARQVA